MDATTKTSQIFTASTKASGAALFSGEEIERGQEVFLRHALMEHGTLWGHGAYLGPDYTADYLRRSMLAGDDDLRRAALEAGLRRWAAGLHRADEHARARGEAQHAGDVVRELAATAVDVSWVAVLVALLVNLIVDLLYAAIDPRVRA